MPTSMLPEDATREFSGEVILPPPVVMNLTLIIRGLSTQASIRFPQFVVPLMAQETSTVDGDWELMTSPPRRGRINGTLTGGRSGFFRGTLTELLGGCEATREFSGQITVAGLNWVAGTMLAPCPGEQLDFGELKLVSSTLGERVPGPTSEFYLFAVSLTGDGSGTVISTPAGIECSVGADADCSQRYREGTDVTLTATPASGSTFSGWGGACAGTASATSVTMDVARSCTATFELPQQFAILGVTLAGAGSGTVTSSPSGIACPADCDESYTTGIVVTLTATSAPGSTFTGWGGDCSGNTHDASVTMDAPKSCTATFDVSHATLYMSVPGTGWGTVASSPGGIECPGDCDEPYAIGTVVTLTATPAPGSTFTGWGGDCSGNSHDTSVTMDAPKSCTATFDVSHALLDIHLPGNGSGTVTSSPAGIECPGDCNELYLIGSMVTLTATPESESKFNGWGDHCGGANPQDRMITVTMESNLSCSPYFEQD